MPCVTQHVEARVVCESGAVAVSWEPSTGASSYTAVAQAKGGYASSCNSSDTTCLFDDLLCSLNYSITVIASDETCSSAGSSAVEINTGTVESIFQLELQLCGFFFNHLCWTKTQSSALTDVVSELSSHLFICIHCSLVPCVPQLVTAEMMCSNDTGIVSWEEGEGVSSYLVQAFGPSGHNAMCNSTTASCQLPKMQCGQVYNLTVTAQDGQCDNSHTYINLQSGECNFWDNDQCQINIKEADTFFTSQSHFTFCL